MPSGVYPRTAYHRKRLAENSARYWLGKKRPSPSAISRAKQSRSMIGKNTWMTGKKHSEDTKRKMALIHAKENLSLETRRKLSESHKGAKSYLWKGGRTSQNHTIRNNVEYKIWRDKVFKRDNYTCQECGDNRGGNLNAHHLKPFSTHIELRFEVSNGITLCVTCHEKTDSYLVNNHHKQMNPESTPETVVPAVESTPETPVEAAPETAAPAPEAPATDTVAGQDPA